jgi:glycosyltransferase involved in cell wall biosynthesis
VTADASRAEAIAPRVTRVLWLTKGLGPGGAERLLVEHAASNLDRGFEFEAAYLLPQKQHLAPELEALGVRTHCLAVRLEADPRWLLRLRRLVRRGRFDVVHAHSPVSASIARVWLRTLRPRPAFVYTEHNRWPSYRPLTRWLNRITYSLNDAVVAVSDDVRVSVSDRSRTRVQTIVHGIDLDAVRALADHRDAVRAELGVGPGDTLAVTIANLREGKDYPLLLDAVRRAVDLGSGLQFVAVGQGPLEHELRARCTELGLDERFRFLGYRADARRVLAGADVFVLASRHEGLPVALMEALALGVPVVAPRVGGVPEAVTEGVSGLLVNPGDVDALALALRRVEDRSLRAELAGGARAASNRFSSASTTGRINAVYRALVARPR